MVKPHIVLASASPRRAELLHQIGLSFEQVVMNVDEQVAVTSNLDALVVSNALAKARAAAACQSYQRGSYVIGADTIVVVEQLVLGKPIDDADARFMLKLLRDRSHLVVSGVAVIALDTGEQATGACTTHVFMSRMSDAELESYIESGEGRDKAGAYGIQGRAGLFVDKIEGSYSNVVGLPLELLRALFSKLGVLNLLAL